MARFTIGTSPAAVEPAANVMPPRVNRRVISVRSVQPVVGAARWDDGYYLTILRQGYRPLPSYGPWQQTNFFPLLPWTTRGVQVIVRSETVAMHVVVTGAQLAAVLLLYAFAKRLFDERTALIAVGLLLLAPASIFLWLFFSEGLFIALSIGALLAADTGRDRVAALLGIGVAMTRSVGVLIAIPLGLAQLQRRRRLDGSLTVALAPVLGLLTVMVAQRIQAGDTLGFVHTSALWGRHNTWPWSALFDRIKLSLDQRGYASTSVADLGSMFACLYLSARAFRIKMPWSLRSWLLLMTFVPLVTGLLFSWSRYMLAAWPASIVAAEALKRRPRMTYVLLGSAMLFLSLHRVFDWHRGVFIG